DVARGRGRGQAVGGLGRIAEGPCGEVDLDRVLDLVHRDLALDLVPHVVQLPAEFRVERRHLPRRLRKILAVDQDGDDDDQEQFAEREAFHSRPPFYFSVARTTSHDAADRRPRAGPPGPPFSFTTPEPRRRIGGRMSEGDAMVDAELVLKFQGGEESAFEALVRKYMNDAYSFCLRLTHDAQEAEELS